MIIEKRWLVKFADVKPGQVFEYDGCYYIKAECTIETVEHPIGMDTVNAVGLEHGGYCMFEYDDDVTLFENAKVVLI